MIIYYNPKCSKCREALDLLENNSCEIEIREYLKVAPSQRELKQLLKLLKCKPIDILRKTEPLYIKKFKDKKFTSAQWVKILAENPILIERPIVIDGEKAIVGRPPIRVLDLLK